MPQPVISHAEMLEETKQAPARGKHGDIDDLDSVSKVSVATPHSRQSQADSVSFVSHLSKTTTQSTRDKLEQIQAELDMERAKRIDAEAKIKALIAKRGYE